VGDDHVISQSRRRCNRQGPRDQSEYASCGLLHRKLILESEILTGKNERPKLYALSDPKHAAAILPTGPKRSAIFAPRIAIRFASILYSLRPILPVRRSKPCYFGWDEADMSRRGFEPVVGYSDFGRQCCTRRRAPPTSLQRGRCLVLSASSARGEESDQPAAGQRGSRPKD